MKRYDKIKKIADEKGLSFYKERSLGYSLYNKEKVILGRAWAKTLSDMEELLGKLVWCPKNKKQPNGLTFNFDAWYSEY